MLRVLIAQACCFVLFVRTVSCAENLGCTGVVFVGGFSYAVVLDSAKGWAGTIRCNKRLADSFTAFYNRCSLLQDQP